MKKFFAVLLIFVICLSLCIPYRIYADENMRKENKSNVAKYALEFVESLYTEKGYETANVIEILNESDCLSGYCIDIVYCDSPSGYVIVKFSENQPVVSEFCIEVGAENPFEIIKRKYKLFNDSGLFYYSIGLNDYQIYSIVNRTMYGINEKRTLKEFKIVKKEYENYKKEMMDKFTKEHPECKAEKAINYSSLDGWTVISNSYTGTYIDGDIIDGAGSISYYCTSDVNSAGLTYACSVVALSNLMKYYRYKGKTNIDSNFSTLYSSLWNYAGTDSLGGTTNGDEAPAAVSYMSSKGYSISYDNYWWDWFSSFVQDTEDDRPMLFTYGAYFNGNEGGHATFCVGYVETSDYDYLIVADGWNSYLRYINFNGYDYTRKDGWSFTKP